MKGTVYLVGAGCGGRDWITLRGLELLRSCDAVVYDDLIDSRLLEEVPSGAERIPVGKRCGRHSAPQEEINRILTETAEQGKTVVRLKGGDPFVFGRGGEEIQTLRQAGIPYEVVPGITSAVAIAGAAGIPVTHRRLSRSFLVMTGHTADGGMDLVEDPRVLAQFGGTLVVLMGLHSLPTLTKQLLAAGKASDTPAAVISGGNSPHPVTVRGTLKNIAEKSREVQAPAIIVIGSAAALDFSGTVPRPLAGVNVGLTGTDRMTNKLCKLLGERGGVCVRAERSVCRPIEPEFDWNTLTDGRPHWITLTGGNGTERFFNLLREKRVDVRRLGNCRFAVIGKATEETLRQHGIFADLCPEKFTGEALGYALCEAVNDGEDVLIFRSAQGSQGLTRVLAESGIPYRDIPIYDLDADESVQTRSHLDYLVFSSAGGVRLYRKQHSELPKGTTIVCIGPTAAGEMEKQYGGGYLLAEEISAEGIAHTIENHHSKA